MKPREEVDEKPESTPPQLEVKGTSVVPRMRVGAWLLKDCWQALQGPTEGVGYLTGPASPDEVQYMERFVEVAPEIASPVYVRGQFVSSHEALMEMEQYGYRLYAWIHNHPGSGRAASEPSSIDLAYQERLERGYRSIGIILNADGRGDNGFLVRAFSRNLPFELEVYGKGVSQLEKNLFQLS